MNGRHTRHQGDKLAAIVFSRVTKKYSLPLTWMVTLAEIFTSNRYWAKLSDVFELDGYCDGIYNHTPNKGDVDGDILEVSILFCFRTYILVYFAALDSDPLYLFTEEKIENHLSHFFEQHLKPALLYVQETFSSPIGLDHVWVPPLTDATNPDDIKIDMSELQISRAQSNQNVRFKSVGIHNGAIQKESVTQEQLRDHGKSYSSQNAESLFLGDRFRELHMDD